MISKSEYLSDVRVRREAEALTADGHEVTVIDVTDSDMEHRRVRVMGTGPTSGLGSRRPSHRSLAFRFTRWVLLPEHRQRANSQFQSAVLARAHELDVAPDAVHAHDFPALAPGVALAERFGAKLVYDAHEYWYGLARFGRPEPLRKRRNRIAERTLSRRADWVLTVSEGAASLLSRDYDLEKIMVVRNTFPVNRNLGPPERPTGAVYAGRISRGRDLETAFNSSIWDDNFRLTLMGPMDGSLDVPDTVNLVRSGALADVDRLLADVGIALVTLEQGPLNHDIALPNKLFQAISVGIPVVAVAMPEINRFIDEWEVGTVYRPGDPESLAEAIRQVVNGYDKFIMSVEEARNTVNWDTDRRKLLEVYAKLDSRGT